MEIINKTKKGWVTSKAKITSDIYDKDKKIKKCLSFIRNEF
jgi:hypothetical protein